MFGFRTYTAQSGNIIKISALILLLSSFLYTSAQEISVADSVYHYVEKPFSPPVEAVIKNMLYSKAQVFLANDIYNKKHNLLNYRGKYVLLWFWNKDCPLCEQGLPMLDSIKSKYNDRIEVFAFANESKPFLQEYFKDTKPEFNVMYNSKIFGEMMYAGSLSYPRLFLIDKQGFIVKILPSDFFESNSGFSEIFTNIIDEYFEKK